RRGRRRGRAVLPHLAAAARDRRRQRSAPARAPARLHRAARAPGRETKPSTASVYAAFDGRDGARGFEERRAALELALAELTPPRDLAPLPPNDLAASGIVPRLTPLGAFRADVSGAGPTVYALFENEAAAVRAQRDLEPLGRCWITAPTC